MIINIRGTSGSGKTHVMRQWMKPLFWTPEYIPGRKQPAYYKNKNMAVLGHYESACGGCDNIGSAASVYKLIKEIEPKFNIILCEGLLLSEDVKWSSQLEDLHILFLTTPTETCLEQIKSRRLAAGNEKPLNVDNTVKRVAVIERARLRLIEAGVDCRRCTSAQAVGLIENWVRRERRRLVNTRTVQQSTD